MNEFASEVANWVKFLVEEWVGATARSSRRCKNGPEYQELSTDVFWSLWLERLTRVNFPACILSVASVQVVSILGSICDDDLY
jgi:hypothetical protein